MCPRPRRSSKACTARAGNCRCNWGRDVSRPRTREDEMPNRRTFMKQCARGAAGVAVSGLVSSSRVLGANDRIRFGLIGCGSRGKEIFRAAMRSPNAEAVAAADLYPRRLDEVKALAPSIKTYKDFRQLLDDKNVDAVLIATPQHQH